MSSVQYQSASLVTPRDCECDPKRDYRRAPAGRGSGAARQAGHYQNHLIRRTLVTFLPLCGCSKSHIWIKPQEASHSWGQAGLAAVIEIFGLIRLDLGLHWSPTTSFNGPLIRSINTLFVSFHISDAMSHCQSVTCSWISETLSNWHDSSWILRAWPGRLAVRWPACCLLILVVVARWRWSQ